MKRNWKRLPALVLALTLLLTQQVFAVGKLTVTAVSGRTGEQVAVEIRLTGDDVCSGNFDVCYNSDLLRLVSAEQGNGSWLGSVNEREEGRVRVSFAQTTPLTDAVLCLLTFEVLENTPAEGTAVTLEKVRLYDANSNLVSTELEFGSVSRDCVWYTLECGDTVEGQGVRAEVKLTGTVQPTGGSFAITYDASVLKATSILLLSGLDGCQVDYNLDEAGVVRIAFAGNTPVDGGTLCAVIFQAVGSSGSTTQLELTDVRAYDENSDALDSAITNGEISIVLPTEADPKLWIVGGSLNEDGTATASVVLQGRGRVCGGQFTLKHDSALTATVEPQNGVEIRQEAGLIHVSWARESASMEAETLITVTFSDAFVSDLTFDSNVRVYDVDSEIIGVVDIRPGSITKNEQVHITVDDVEVEVTEDSAEVSVSVDLADADFFTEEQVRTATAMLVLYYNGRLCQVVMETEIQFRDGVAELSLSAYYDGTISDYTVFVINEDAAPMCGAVASE